MFEQYSEVWNIKELCLALKISRRTAYSLLVKGEIPYRKIGRNYKILKKDVISFLNTTTNNHVLS